MSGPRRRGQRPPRSTAEWTTLSVALLVLAGVIGAVIVVWLGQPSGPPRFRVELGEVRQDGSQFYLAVRVSNLGGTTAGEVMLEGVLASGGAEETATTTFDFVPGGASVDGVLIFSRDPSAATVRVISYQQP